MKFLPAATIILRTSRHVVKQEAAAMGDTWIVSLDHMLDENGAIAAPEGLALNLDEGKVPCH